MLRFVVAPDHRLVFDDRATLPGRGLWLSASADVLNQSVKRGVFARAAKSQVIVPVDLSAIVQAALTRRVLELCGLARRGGAAIAGFEKAREWLSAGRAGVVLQAADGSADERARFLGNSAVPAFTVLSAAQLGQIFGREHIVHAIIAPGPLADKIIMEAKRLTGVASDVLSGQ